jgi:hypothetical protein
LLFAFYLELPTAYCTLLLEATFILCMASYAHEKFLLKRLLERARAAKKFKGILRVSGVERVGAGVFGGLI